MRFFNTAGPINPADHYHIPALARLDRDELLMLIAQKKYFVLHAPRQTGKTSALLALRDLLNSEGRYRCVYVNVEVGQSAREDVAAAMQAILGSLGSAARIALKDNFIDDFWVDILAKQGAHNALQETLSRWAANDAKPAVLLIDEIDSLIGDTLISVLRQLRSGYAQRPEYFPQSVILCGVRDVRDYRIHSSQEKAIITGGSAFNIKAKSLRLGNFVENEVYALYQQHTDETGQAFSDDALARVWELTQGQPWLVNALGYETCFEMKSGRERSQPIALDMIEEAKENLILRRETHLDQLINQLQEKRVQRVIEPILVSDALSENLRPDDVSYVVDLGLITQSRNGALSIANPIYQEIVPRELAWTIQSGMSEQSQWYIQDDGRLDMNKLLQSFQVFFREHSEHWLERYQYKEAGPQLLLQAFLQRVVNGGGRIEREYGLGRLRTDLLIIWPHPGGIQKIVIELKILHQSLQKTIELGLQQTWAYLDRCAAEQAHLVIFDRSEKITWEEKLFQRAETVHGHTITIWGM